MVRTSSSSAGDVGSILSWGPKIPHTSGLKNQSIKQKPYCNKFSKVFKNGPHQEKIFIKKITEIKVTKISQEVLVNSEKAKRNLVNSMSSWYIWQQPT